MKPRLPIAFRFFIAITMVQSATAAIGTWNGATNNTWDTTATNWSDVIGTPWDVTNGPGNTATFNTTSLAAIVSGPVYTNGITFSTTGAISGSTIHLVGTTPSISVATGQTATISSIIAGSAGLVKSDAGLLTLSGANSYTGGTTVSAGRLQLVNNKTGSSNFITNADLEFNLTSGTQQLNGGTISGTGNLIKTGGSQMWLGANNSAQTVALTGATSIIDVQGGVLRNEYSNSAWGNNKAGLTVAAGAFFDVWDGAATVDELNGAGTINKGWSGNKILTIGVNNGSGTFSGVILNNATNLGYGGQAGGNLSLVKQGTGTQILSGINTYAGATTISAGTLQLSGAGALSSSTAVSVANGATFDVGGRNQTISGLSGAGSVTNSSGVLTVNKTSGLDIFSGVLSGATGLTKTGAGAVSLSGVNTYSGATIVSGGVLGVRKSSTSGITVAAAGGLGLAVGAGATYYTSADVDSLWAGSLSGVTIDNASLVGIDTTAGDFTYTTPNSNLSRGFAKLGSNTLTLDGTNAYTGGTTVVGGVVRFTSAAARPGTGTVTVSAGAGVSLGSVGAESYTTANIDSLWANGVANVSLSTNSLVGIDTTAGDLTYTTPASNLTRGLAKVGVNTLTLTGANAYTGGTYVATGKLILEDTKTGGNNFITNADLEFKLNSAGQTLNGGTISGTGNLIKTGTNTLSFGANNSPQTIALTGADSIFDIRQGTVGQNWFNSAWNGNLAGMNIESGATFNIGDGNASVDELTGSGSFTKSATNATTLTVGVNNGTGNFTGTLTQTGGTLAVIKNGTGTQTFSGSTAYNGGTTVNGGRLKFVNSKSGSSNFVTNAELEFNVTTGNQQLANGTISGTGNLIKTGAGALWLGASNQPQTIALTGANSIIDVQGGTLRNEYLNSAWGGNKAGLTVASSAFFDIWDGDATVDELNGSGTIQKGLGGTGTLTIGVNDGSGTFSGTIRNTAGTLALVKQGTGTQTLTGTISHSGATTVNKGKLIINGNISTSTTTVKNTATLGGSGVAAAVIVESGGTLAPGNSIDQFDTKTLTLATGSIFQVEIDTASSYDQLGITGDLNITSGARLDLVDFGSPDLIALYSRLTIMDYSGAWNNGLFTLGTEELSDSETFAWQSNTWRINYNDNLGPGDTSLSDGGTAVTLTVVPEPAAALLGSIGLLALLRRRR